MPRTDALLLDLDGTLLDHAEVDLAIRGTAEAIVAFRPSLDLDTVLTVTALSRAEHWAALQTDWNSGAIDDPAYGLLSWGRILTELDIHDEAFLGRLTSTWCDLAAAHQHPYADVNEFLERATDAGARLAIVTNGPPLAQRAKLARVGIREPIDAVVVSGEVGSAKPDPAIFRHALDLLESTPDAAWHVGDMLDTDVVGARNAGIRSVWLNRGGARNHLPGVVPDREVRSLAELGDWWV